MRYDAASVGKQIPTFRGKIMSSSSEVEMSQGIAQHIPGETEEHYENLRTVGVPESDVRKLHLHVEMIK